VNIWGRRCDVRRRLRRLWWCVLGSLLPDCRESSDPSALPSPRLVPARITVHNPSPHPERSRLIKDVTAPAWIAFHRGRRSSACGRHRWSFRKLVVAKDTRGASRPSVRSSGPRVALVPSAPGRKKIASLLYVVPVILTRRREFATPVARRRYLRCDRGWLVGRGVY